MKYLIPTILFSSLILTACLPENNKPIIQTLEDNKVKAKQSLVEAQKRQIKIALDMYRLENMKYPSNTEGLKVLTEKKLLPDDFPLGDYKYKLSPDNSYQIDYSK